MLALLLCPGFLLAQAPHSVAGDPFASARQALSQSQYEPAGSALDRVDAKDLTLAQRFELGWLYGQAHRFDTALQVFHSVPDSVPDVLTHAYAAALCEFQLGRYRAVVELLEPFSAQAAFGPRQANLLGVAYSKTEAMQKAFDLFHRTIAKDPSDPQAYFNSVTLLCETGHTQECLETARLAVQNFPDSAQARIMFGATELENGQFAAAREEFLEARQIDSRNPETSFLIAVCAYRLGDYSTAIATLQSAIREGVADADVHTLLSECFSKQDPPKTEPALAELDQALTLAPGSATALTARGKIHFSRGEYPQAASDLERALAHDETSRSATYLLARTYQALGRAGDSRRLLARIRTTPGDSVSELEQGHLDSVLKGNGQAK